MTNLNVGNFSGVDSADSTGILNMPSKIDTSDKFSLSSPSSSFEDMIGE